MCRIQCILKSVFKRQFLKHISIRLLLCSFHVSYVLLRVHLCIIYTFLQTTNFRFKVTLFFWEFVFAHRLHTYKLLFLDQKTHCSLGTLRWIIFVFFFCCWKYLVDQSSNGTINCLPTKKSTYFILCLEKGRDFTILESL